MTHLTSRTAQMAIVLVALTLLTLFWSPSPAYARAECARISRVAGQSMLVNTCGVCRSIQVIKDRSGNALPRMRTFVLSGGEKYPLPSKGPGGIRIVNDGKCRELTGKQENGQQAAANARQRCVFPMRTTRGIALVNGCESCRAVIIERQYADGREIHKSYTMKSKDALAFSDEGAVSAKIVHDAACKT